MIPNGIVHAKPHELAEQKVELQPLHQLALRADRIESPQQLLQRDGPPAERRIERRELFLKRRQSLVHELADRPQGIPTRASRST